LDTTPVVLLNGGSVSEEYKMVSILFVQRELLVWRRNTIRGTVV
jgi:hypothetical protein